MLNELYTQADFLNLTSDDVNKIKEVLNLDIPSDTDDYEYLYENISILECDEQVNEIISQKILAGQISIKWFTFKYNEKFTKEVLRRRLESQNLGYNVNITERLRIDININNDIVSIIKNENLYTLKIFIPGSYKRVTNGVHSRRERSVRSVIVNIDIDNCWIEIRTNEDNCKKINKILELKLGFPNVESIRILGKYDNDIHRFKDDLIDGFYLKYKAIPSEEVELTEQDGIAIATIVGAIDEYLENENAEKLIDTLEKLNYDTEGLAISSILLAGIDNMGMKVKKDSKKDVSEQSLYTLLKDDLIEDSSYIRFSTVANGMKYTMQVGMKSNSIVFRTSVTEEVISYIRNKIL
ncbi:MAG: hypothetical protein ACRCWM_01925 [Sarcina sp.]